MNFDFDLAQKELGDQVARVLRGRDSLKRLRQTIVQSQSIDRELWGEVADMGILGVQVPERFGGLGLGALELCRIAEEIGRYIPPIPFSACAYFSAEAFLLSNDDALCSEYLPKLCSGSIISTLAHSEPDHTPILSFGHTVLYEDGTVSGVKSPVVFGDIADLAIVPALSRSKEPVLALVDLSHHTVDRETLTTVDDTRSYASLSFHMTPARPLGAVGDGARIYRDLLQRAAVYLAFEQLGGAEACLAMACDYATTRHAFGQPIGAFQAIKHKLADGLVANEMARSNAYFAAWALSAGDAQLPLLSAIARVSATDAYEYNARENIQTHGGIGFTWETDCHFYLRRARALTVELGGQLVWKEQIARALTADVAGCQ